MSAAQALIEDADAAGEKVTVWITDSTIDFRPGAVQVMQHVTHVLNDLGLRAELRTVHDNDKYWSAIYTRGKPQIYLTGWGANYPGAGGFIDDDLRCSAPGTAVALCTKRIDAEVQEAQQLQATDPAAANRAWTQIEHQLVQEAVWAPLTNPLSAYAFSARVENIQVHPEWGILLSRLWVQ